MTITIREAQPAEQEELVPLLLLAEPSRGALEWSLEHMSDTIYRMDDDGQLVGAATMRWKGEPCEIIELAVAPGRQGQGLGRQLVTWLIDEAKRRGKKKLLVGTGNSSLENIAFYQKVGLRMDHVRRDYFWYHRKPVIENGIVLRDMLVFSWEAEAGKQVRKPR
jgi:GNAT superfamily N-acetyltransferase